MFACGGVLSQFLGVSELANCAGLNEPASVAVATGRYEKDAKRFVTNYNLTPIFPRKSESGAIAPTFQDAKRFLDSFVRSGVVSFLKVHCRRFFPTRGGVIEVGGQLS
jgi:hypothetical protein